MKRIGLTLVLAVLVGCAPAAPQLAVEPRVAEIPRSGEVTVASRQLASVGDIVPIGVNVANGTDARYRIDANQVFAINEAGQRLAPIPTSEAIRLSGDATALSAQVQQAVVYGVGAAALGAATGAVVGVTRGQPGMGAALGAALLGAIGTLAGFFAGGEEARLEAAQQIDALALRDQSVDPGYSVSGYVFFPRGNYTRTHVLITGEEGETRTLEAPVQR
jgi:hypothetical protein